MNKSLEALEKIKNWECFVDFELETIGEKEFGEELSIIEKELKALEIIKEKGVDIWALKHLDDEYYVEQYNAVAHIEKPYTKEEYDLLEEVLTDD